MSLSKNVEVECPKCGTVHTIVLHSSINTSISPELKDKLISGELTTLQCDCGESTRLNYSLLYHKQGLNESIMLQYTTRGIKEVQKEFEESVKFMQRFSLPIMTVPIFEVFTDWSKFIDRVKEI